MAGEQLRVTEGKERGKRLSVDADLLIGGVAPDDGEGSAAIPRSRAAMHTFRAGPTDGS